MIRAITGLPGSGKSYYVASATVNAVKDGKKVLTNMELSLPALSAASGSAYVDGEVVGLRQLHRGEDFTRFYCADGEGSALLVLDESASYFNARQWKDDDRQNQMVFFQQHRKLGFDVLLVAQRLAFIDKQVRELVEFEVKAKNLARRLPLIKRRPLFFYRTEWTETNDRKKDRVRAEYEWFRPSVGALFDTRQIVQYPHEPHQMVAL